METCFLNHVLLLLLLLLLAAPPGPVQASWRTATRSPDHQDGTAGLGVTGRYYGGASASTSTTSTGPGGEELPATAAETVFTQDSTGPGGTEDQDSIIRDTLSPTGSNLLQSRTDGLQSRTESRTESRTDGLQSRTESRTDGLQSRTESRTDGLQSRTESRTESRTDGLQSRTESRTESRTDGLQSRTESRTDGLQSRTESRTDGLQTSATDTLVTEGRRQTVAETGWSSSEHQTAGPVSSTQPLISTVVVVVATTEASISTYWEDLEALAPDLLLPPPHHIVSQEPRPWTSVTEEARLPRDSPETGLRMEGDDVTEHTDAGVLAGGTSLGTSESVHTDDVSSSSSAFISTTISRAGERTLLSVTSSSSSTSTVSSSSSSSSSSHDDDNNNNNNNNSTSSMFTEVNSNSQQPPSTWGLPGTDAGSEDYNHSLPSSTRTHNTPYDMDVTRSEHRTLLQSSTGTLPETGNPEVSEGSPSFLTGRPNNATQQHGLTSVVSEEEEEEEGTPDVSTPSLRVTEEDTTGQEADTDPTEAPPIVSSESGVTTNTSAQDPSSEVNTVTQEFSAGTQSSSSSSSTLGGLEEEEEEQGGTERVPPPHTAEEEEDDERNTVLALTTATPTPEPSVVTVLEDTLAPQVLPETDRPALATELLLTTTPVVITHRPQVTEEEETTSRATAAPFITSTHPPPPASTLPPQLSSSGSTPPTQGPPTQRSTHHPTTASTTTATATSSTTTSTLAPRTTLPTSPHTQRPSTRPASPTNVTTLRLETSTASPLNTTTTRGGHATTTSAYAHSSSSSTPAAARATPTPHTTGRQTDRLTTEPVPTAAELVPTTAPMEVRPTKAPPASPCAVNPCMNGGMCVSREGGKFTCHCQQAWKGPTCSEDANECEHNPCPPGSMCVNTRGSFSCECPLGFDLEDGRTCTKAKTFLGTFSVNRKPHDPDVFKSVTVHEIQREIVQLLNASLSILHGYRRSTLRRKGADGLRILAINMFSVSSDVTSAEVYKGIEMYRSNCSSSMAHCRVVLHHQLTYHVESLCVEQNVQCDTQRSACADNNGTASCQCLPGYYKQNPDALSCIDCGDGYKLSENGTCVQCMFGFGGFNCGNFYKLIAVVVSPAEGALLIVLMIALIITCCKKDKNDINKIIFKSGDLQMSPYAEFPKSNRVSMEWGRETIEMQENGSTKNLLQMTDIYYSPALRNSDLERNGLYPFSGLPGSRHSCIYPAQWNPSFISDDSRRRDYF